MTLRVSHGLGLSTSQWPENAMAFSGKSKPTLAMPGSSPLKLSSAHINSVTRLINGWGNPDGHQPFPQQPLTLKTLSEWLVNQPSQRATGLTPIAAQPLIKRILDDRLAELVQDHPVALHHSSRIADVIKVAQRIAIAAPFAPTGQTTDALLVASSLASRLKTLWPEKTIDLMTPATLRTRQSITANTRPPFYDAMITLGLSQLNKADPVITTAASQSHVLINMDNALTNTVYGTPGLNWINPFSPNRALMVQALLAELPKLDQATALLLGQSDLITHQRFTKNTFSPSDHQLFADIVDTGVDTQRHFNLSPTLTMAQLPVLGHALSNLEQHESIVLTHLPAATHPVSKQDLLDLQERLMDTLDVAGAKTLVILQPQHGTSTTHGWLLTKYPKLLPSVKHAVFSNKRAPGLKSWIPSDEPKQGTLSLRPPGSLKGVGFVHNADLNTTRQHVLALLNAPVSQKGGPSSRAPGSGRKRFGSQLSTQLYGQSAFPSDLLTLIRNPAKKRVLVVAHTEPDGDALGSILGLGTILETYGKDVTIGYDGLLPRGLPVLPGQNRLMSFADFQATHASLKTPKPFDVVFLLDSSGIDRTGAWQPIIEQARTKVNIDHHPSPATGFDYSWIDLRAASTTELIAVLAQTLDETEPIRKKPLLKNTDIQASLYRGMVTDTGSFLYGSTKRTHELAAKLSSGASRWPKPQPTPMPPPVIGSSTRTPRLVEFYQLQGKVLAGAVIDPEAKRIRLSLTQAMVDDTKNMIRRKHQQAQHGNPELAAYKDLDLTKLDDALMVQVKGPVSRMASTLRMDDGALPNQLVFFHQIGPDVRISFRYQHAGDMARWFGGGGHAKAAGAQVPNQTVEGVVADFEQRLKTTPLNDDSPRRQWIQYLIQDSLAIERAHASA